MTARRIVLACLLLVLGACVAVGAARAHSVEPRIEITPERLGTGQELTIRGVGFDDEQRVMLRLAGQDGLSRLAVVASDAEGGFTHAAVVPEGLTGGTYRVTAEGGHDRAESVPFAITGSAASPSDEEGGRRDQSDPLLAPVAATGEVTAGSEGTTAVTVAATPGDDRDVFVRAAIAGLAAAALGVGVAAATRRRRRDR